MGCCSTFTAAASAAPADPSRHVNFTTGMVLGVDDYRQEFAYHSSRDKWIVRDLLGYGTLSGLAVDIDNDGTKGPRVKVSAGSAAAPSGQLICVGRDQCGWINPWLARKEVVERLGENPAATTATLSLFLTLCYVDCPVADVPIPGEPCRSDDNLMAPSRIQDDYCLEFRMDAPPPMREAQALDALTAFWPTLSLDATLADSATVFDTALRKTEVQLRLAMGIPVPAAPPASDLAPVAIHPNALGRFSAAVKRLWITRLRPAVVAQRCSANAVSADDCLLLSRLTVPIIKAGDHWEVASPPAGQTVAVTSDENERPLLLAAGLGQTAVGSALAADGKSQKLAFVAAAADTIPTDATLVIVSSASAFDVKFPGSTQTNSGRVITIKSASAVAMKLAPPASTTIDGKNDLTMDPNTTLTLISDGANKNWFVASSG